MERVKTHKRWFAGVGAAALLLVGGLAAGPIAGLAQGGPDADLSRDEAIEIAVAEYPDTRAIGVELDDDDGLAVYEIELSNGYDIEIDGNSGQILERDGPDDDDWDEPGRLDDDATLQAEAAISLDEAIAAAEGAADGTVHDIELDYHGDRLVYEVEVGHQEVIVDATDGSIIRVANDD